MKPLSNIPRQFAAAFAAIALVGLTFTTIGGAAPADDLRRAMAAQGARSNADAQSFLRAFAAVMATAKPAQAPGYVAAAVRMRPDVAPNIVRTALRAMSRGDRGISCEQAGAIVRAAVSANAAAAATIVSAALEAAPGARDCVVAAAIEAAPDQRVAIEQAAARFAGGGGGGVFNPVRNPGLEAGGFDALAAGTINPANVSSRPNSPNQERVTICHRNSANERGTTLVLPRQAAEQHIRQHPNDSLGACR